MSIHQVTGVEVQEIMTNEKKHTIESKFQLNILIVDDNLIIRQVIGRLLELVDCHYVMVSNGEKALVELEKDHYDLIMMDLQMPEMNGFETTARIRAMERETGEYIPILAMTGFHLENGFKKCINAGMDDYLEKPFNIAELFKIIERLTDTKLDTDEAD